MELIKPNDNEFPICSFCEKELKQIKTKIIDKGFFKTIKNAFFYPHCNKILGVSQWA